MPIAQLRISSLLLANLLLAAPAGAVNFVSNGDFDTSLAGWNTVSTEPYWLAEDWQGDHPNSGSARIALAFRDALDCDAGQFVPPYTLAIDAPEVAGWTFRTSEPITAPPALAALALLRRRRPWVSRLYPPRAGDPLRSPSQVRNDR